MKMKETRVHMRRPLRLLVALLVVGSMGVVLSVPAGASEAGSKRASAVAKKKKPKKKVHVGYVDMVLGSTNLTTEQKAAGLSCVLTSRYAHNQQVVWRARVVDGATGTQLDDKGLTSLIVKLADGQTFPMKFGEHPKAPPTDSFWSASWKIPETYPSGTVTFTITGIATDGTTTTFSVFNVAPSLIIVTPEVTPVIPAA